MIAKSDIIILLVATTALGVSVLRWSAVQPAAPRAITATVPPSSSAPAAGGSPAPAAPLDNAAASAGNPPLDPPIDPATGTNGASAAGNPSTAANATTNAATGNGSNAVPEPGATTGGNGTGLHTVVSGDSLGVIANRYDTSVLELQVINGLEGTTIYVGQELRYPLASD